MKLATFHRKKRDTEKRVVDFPLERDTFRNKIMEIVEDFYEKRNNNNGKPWKSSRIFRVHARSEGSEEMMSCALDERGQHKVTCSIHG